MRKRHQRLSDELVAFVSKYRQPPTAAASNLPKISIITPSYNQADFLERTILSVLNQGYPNLEYIVIDGGSTDGSVDIIKRYAAHLTHWESEKDRGQSHAINKGFMRATGDYVAWQNSDDLYFPGALLKLGEAAAATRAPIVSGNLLVADANNHIYRKVHYTPMTRRLLTVVKASIPNQSALMRRDLMASQGFLQERMRYCMDLELWSRLLKSGSNVVVPDAYGVYTTHDQTKTSLIMDVHDRERAQIVADIQRDEGGMSALYPIAARVQKVATHTMQGDLPYLFEKAIAKIAGRDAWDEHATEKRP